MTESRMNEKLQELAELAGFVYIKDEGIGWAGQYNSSLPKFAELIVRECANVAAEHDALDIYEEIREHFGVEE